MRHFWILFGTLSLTLSVNSQVKELRTAQEKRKEYVKTKSEKSDYFSKSLYVNPFIGTGGHGHTYPGASAPFGFIQLSPDTRYDGWDGCSGYHYSDSVIYGFSHTHLSGTGVPDYADLLIVPQSGLEITTPGYLSKNGYGSKFSHENEKASPGYYSVHLDDPNIDVELSVTERSGYHSYTFNNKNEKRYILIDLDHRDVLLSHDINILNNTTVQGNRVSKAWAEEQHFYFHLETSKPFLKSKMITKKGQHKLLLSFDKSINQIDIRVGISGVDELGAKNNLEKEIPNWNMNAVKGYVSKIWNDELDCISFYSEDKNDMVNFYTALYHSFLAPNIYSDVDGRYRGRDNKIHQLEETEEQYTVFSLWDTYRATHPLYTLTQIERTDHFIETFLRQFDQGGDLPVWELSANETECMIGYHSVSVMADAYIKNIGSSDIDRVIKSMIATATFNELGKREFHEKGYIDAGDEPESVSKGLEYAYDDFCISTTIQTANKKEGGSYTDPFELSQFNFINNYDPNSKFMRARRSAQWYAPFDPAEVNYNYTEANSWQYSLYAPHAVGVLRDLLGGKDSLELWLDKLFTTTSTLSGRHQVDITGLIGQYAHGNEPSHHMAFLYNYTNTPSKTQKYTTQIMNELYHNAPDGLSGNEDCGQMSSWYVLASLGLYQIAPGNPYYDITRPIVDKAIVKLENGKELRIKTINNKKENIYIERVRHNGKELSGNYLHHDQLLKGGELIFELSSKPNAKMNKLPHAPTIEHVPNNFVSVPYFNETESVFNDSITLSLGVVYPKDASIYYTLDGSTPTNQARLYTTPFTVDETTTIKTIAISNNGQSSITNNRFSKIDNNTTLTLHSTYSQQYTAGGELTLIDKKRGKDEYRTGDWQGYWDQDFIADIDFIEPVLVDSIGLGCLSDMKSWIFFPSEIIIEVSTDGKKFKKLPSIKIQPETKADMAPHNKTFKIATRLNEPILKIKVTAKSPGLTPDWHISAGNPTWMFFDEITLD